MISNSGSSNSSTLARVDIVVPCYNEEAALPETHRVLSTLMSHLVARNEISTSSRIVFVDDGSSDRTWALINDLTSRDLSVVGVRLSANRGHQNALLAGLELSTADAVLTVDADLQDDVDVIPEMIREFSAGADVVYGVRRHRPTDTAFKRISARLYYSLLRSIGVAIVPDHADFRLMGRPALDRLKHYSEVNLFLRGIVPLVGHRTAKVFYDRKARTAGETKYPLRKMLGLAVDGVTSFSAVPLRAIAAMGFLVFIASIAMTLWVLWIRIFTDTAIPGWASSAIPIYFLGGVQLLSIGVVGEYVAKIYLETKRRPRFFIEEVAERSPSDANSVRASLR